VILSDRTIREELAAGRIVLEPLDESLIQPSSVDVRLDRYFRVFLNHTMPVIDVKKNLEELTRLVEIDEGNSFVLHPGEFVLGSTLERIALPDDLVARIEGKSSLGRLGLVVHATAGFCDPGWKGTLTLELANFNSVPIILRPGLPIAQLSFMTLDRPAERPYGHPDLGSHYHGQVEATESRYEGGPQPEIVVERRG
jgi:dCTP deaminase